MTSPIGAGEQPDGSAIGVGTEVGGGRYVLVKAIGRGGMGDIYKAFDRQLDRVVAIKAIRADIESDADSRKRLAREARVAASLDHPFICKIHELIQHGEGDLLLVMEYINGHSLKDVLDSGPITAGQAVLLAREMAEALSVAHQRGLIHRDIKPSNIMLTSHGHVKLVDFGIAKAAHKEDAETITGVTQPGRIIGTRAYMAPEHAAGRTIDARADIYSFGAVLYECLAGKVPFNEPDVEPGNMIAAATAALPQSAPAELRALVMKCLEWKRENRYENFDAVRAALDVPSLNGLATGSGIRGGRADSWGRPRIWVLLAAAGIAIAALGWAWTLWTAGRARPAAVALQRPIVTWPTREEGSRVSADGQKIVFISTQRGQSRLWVQAVDGTDPAPVGGAGDRIKTPVWSPDGQNLAYLFSQNGVTGIQIIAVWGERKPGQSTPVKGDWDNVVLVRWIGTRIYFSVGGTKSVLWRWDTKAGSVDQVTHAQGKRFTSTGRFANVDVLPDESRIVFEAAAPDDRRLWTADLDGRNAVNIGVGPVVISPRWRGAGGKRIIYVSNANGQNDIWEFNLDTRAATALTTSPLEETAIDASAAGDVLVADTLEDDAHLWAMDADRQEAPRQLTFDSRTDLWPVFGAQANQMIFHRRKGAFVTSSPTDTDLILARWKDGRLTDETTLAAGSSGVLSPDGRRVAFVRFRDQNQRNSELWVKDVGSVREPVRVSEGVWFPGFAVANWDAGGQTIAWAAGSSSVLYFVRRTKAVFDLVEATLDDTLTAKTRVLTKEENAGRASDPLQFPDLAVAPDGSSLAYVVARWLPYQGSTLHVLDLSHPDSVRPSLYETPDGSEVSIAGWRRGGSLIAVVSPNPERPEATRIVEIHPDNRKNVLATVPGLLGFTARLDAARDRLYATVVSDGVATVGQVSLRDGVHKTILPNPVDGITFGGLAISPEGWLVYMRKETNHNVWLFDFRKAKRN